MNKKLISIIIPAYNEEECVDELARRLKKVCELETKYDFQIVIVENGSVDSTFLEHPNKSIANPNISSLKIIFIYKPLL